jgi:uncharacterized protein
MADADLKTTIQQQMNTALKGGNKDRLSVLRMMLSEIKRKETDCPGANPQEAVTAYAEAVTAYAKTLRKSMSEMEKLGQTEHVTKLKAELVIVSEFLPKEIDDASMEKIVGEVLHGLGPVSKKDQGRVIGAVMKAIGATGMSADAGKVRASVESKLI